MPTADELIIDLTVRIDRLERETRKARDEMDRTRRNFESNAAAIGNSMRSLAGTLAAALSVQQLAQYADMWTRFTNQLRVSGVEGRNLARVQEQLFGIAQRYGVELESLGTLYGRTSQGARELGATQADLIRFTTGVAAALKVQGADATQARGALIQLTQALGGEIVRAEEFNSINEGARPILQAVANGIDRYRGSVAALRRDVVEGRVSSQEFFQAFLTQVPQLEQQATRANFTIGQAFIQLNNAIGRYVGQTDQTLSASARVAEGIKLLADNIDTVAAALGLLITAMGARFVAAGVVFIATQVRMAQASIAVARGIAGVTTAVSLSTAAMAAGGAAATGLGSGLLAAFGGPIGVTVAALAAGIWYFASQVNTASTSSEQFNEAMANARVTLQQTDAGARAAASSIQQTGNNAQTAAGQMNEFAGATGAAARQLYALARANRESAMQQVHTDAETLRSQQAVDRARVQTLQRERGYGSPSNYRFVGAPTAEETRLLSQISQRETMIRALEQRYFSLTRRPPSERDLSPDQIETVQGGIDATGELARVTRDLTIARREGVRATVQALEAERFYLQQYQRYRRRGLSPTAARDAAQRDRDEFRGATSRGNVRRDAEGAGRQPPTVALVRPAGGAVISGFGADRSRVPVNGRLVPGRRHEGVDIAGALGDPVVAPQAGFARRRNSPGGFGQYVEIDHGGGVRSVLAHLSGYEIPEEGARVSAGQLVGRIGATGNARGGRPHLHYARYHGRRAVDPMTARGRSGSEADVEAEIEQAVEREAQRLESVAREENQLQSQLRAARRQLVINVEEQERLARDDVDLEADAYEESLRHKVAQGELTEAEAARLQVLNDQIAVERLRLIDLDRQRRLETEAQNAADRRLRVDTARIEAESELLQISSDQARTAGERRAVELRILALQMQQEELQLRAVLATSERVRLSQTATEQERLDAAAQAQIANARLQVLGQVRAGREEAVRRSTRGPLEAYRDSLLRSSGEISEALEGIAANGLSELNDGLVDAIMNAKSLGDVFSAVANQIIADLLRIAIQRAVIAPLANLLGGGGGGASIGGLGDIVDAGKFFGSLFGGFRATGGPVTAGRAYVVGERRPELFIPGQSGSIVPQVPSAFTGAAGNRPQVNVQQTFVLDARGGITTPQLLEHVQRTARTEAQRAGVAAYQQSMRDAPASVSKARRYGTV